MMQHRITSRTPSSAAVRSWYACEGQGPAARDHCAHNDTLAAQVYQNALPFWGQRAPAFRPGGEWPSPLPLLEHPCSTAGRRTGADPVWGGLRASALCTPCRVFGAFRWASRQRVQQARSTPFARRLAIHPDASSFRRTPGTSLGILSFSREAPGFRHGECHGLAMPCGSRIAFSVGSHLRTLREVVSIHDIDTCASRVLYNVGHRRAGVYSAGERIVGQFPVGLEVSGALATRRGEGAPPVF